MESRGRRSSADYDSSGDVNDGAKISCDILVKGHRVCVCVPCSIGDVLTLPFFELFFPTVTKFESFNHKIREKNLDDLEAKRDEKCFTLWVSEFFSAVVLKFTNQFGKKTKIVEHGGAQKEAREEKVLSRASWRQKTLDLIECFVKFKLLVGGTSFASVRRKWN